MKEAIRLILSIILALILIILVASIIGDFLTWTIKDKINSKLFYTIHVILIFIFIVILFKTKPGKYLDNKIFKIKND